MTDERRKFWEFAARFAARCDADVATWPAWKQGSLREPCSSQPEGRMASTHSRDKFLILRLKAGPEWVGVRMDAYTISGPNWGESDTAAMHLLATRPDVLSYRFVTRGELVGLVSQGVDRDLAAVVRRYVETFGDVELPAAAAPSP